MITVSEESEQRNKTSTFNFCSRNMISLKLGECGNMGGNVLLNC